MRITESRLRRIIRETLAQMEEPDWWRAVTLDHVKRVLSALAKAPPSGWDGPTWNPAGLTELPRMAEPYGLLKAIKGLIEGVSEEKRTPGMKEALGLIDEVAADVGFDIDGAPRAAGAEVEALLNAAWNDEDEEEFGRVVTGEDVASVLDALAQVPLWDPERVEDLYEQLTNLRRLDDLAQVRWGAQDTGLWVLSGIKGWIEREERVAGNTAPGFKLALSRINAIAKREGIGRVDAAAGGVSQVHDIINMAYTG